MELRKLTEADYEAMLELYYQLDLLHTEARPDYFIPRTREEVFPREHYLAGIADPECLFLGVFDSGHLVGTLRATLWQDSGMIKGRKTVCLDNIFVVPSHRRNGVAGRLYQACEDWARHIGALRLELHAWDFNRDALAAYKSWGLRPQRHVLEKQL